MSTTITENPTTDTSDPAQRLCETTAGVKVSISWLGVRKTLSPDQTTQAADVFGAAGEYLSAAKKLLDTRHPTFRAVTSVRSRITGYWKSTTLPYPEPGIRLIRQDGISAFDDQMQVFRQELREAVQKLDDRYDELRRDARRRLGDLYCEADYPTLLQGLFGVEWSFPAVEPPDYLRRLNPELYQQECQRVATRFTEAVQLAEDAFLTELGKLVEHLTERLAGRDDGKSKVFRDTSVTNLLDFFDRFRHLNIGSNQQLEELVDQCRRAVRGHEPQQLRDRQSLRQHVATQLSAVQATIDGIADRSSPPQSVAEATMTAGQHEIVFDRAGNGRCIYDECIDLSAVGSLTIRRGSHVEPDEHGQWSADMSPVNGPILGSFASRGMALAAERQWLREYWLPFP